MGTIHHIKIAISGLLEESDYRLGKIWNKDGREVRAELLGLQLKGDIYIGSEVCEGFDPRTGCPGHPTEDDAKELPSMPDIHLPIRSKDKLLNG